ncbi:hypothetical protein FE257_002765 [Aspergillus nanangensis]|uniref:Uncharacterized protein n=1 Tax=Aspergillus nanangensis TaxID=2582783 RepID=A0AAD4GPX8_ASPNN|nr:hypothetical protein FE257_002765 [Aspergillus nanangensis]
MMVPLAPGQMEDGVDVGVDDDGVLEEVDTVEVGDPDDVLIELVVSSDNPGAAVDEVSEPNHSKNTMSIMSVFIRRGSLTAFLGQANS